MSSHANLMTTSQQPIADAHFALFLTPRTYSCAVPGVSQVNLMTISEQRNADTAFSPSLTLWPYSRTCTQVYLPRQPDDYEQAAFYTSSHFAPVPAPLPAPSQVSSHANLMTMSKQPTAGAAILTAEAGVRSPYLSKLESIASSAVRAADKVREPYSCSSGQ